MSELRPTALDGAKLLGNLGLCARAGKLIFGVPMICDELRRKGGQTLLVLEAADTSENTHKRISDKTGTYGARHVRLSIGGATLAAAVGKTSFLGAVAVADLGMRTLIEKYL